MAIAILEGFDKYGPPQVVGTGGQAGNQFALAVRGEWTVVGANGNSCIGVPLSATGGSLIMVGQNGVSGSGLAKSFGANFATAVGGVRLQVNSFGVNGSFQNIILRDSATTQAAIGVDNSGHILLFNAAGTQIGTSVSTITAGAPHYIEWSIAMSATGGYTIYLDGVSILTGTGNFHGSANNFYNSILFQATGTGGAGTNFSVDDLYIDDGSGSPLLTSPIVQTQFPNSDSAVAFTQGAYAVGYWNALSNANATAPGVALGLRGFTCPAGGVTLNSVSFIPQATSAAAKVKAVLYADSAGSPGSLIATGTEVIGTVAGTVFTAPFASGQTLSAGTAYWIGYITDTSVVIAVGETSLAGRAKANTYASGAPNPAGTMTTGLQSWMMWGNTSAATTNNAVEAEQAPLGIWGDFGFVTSSTIGNEDLFGFPALTGSPVSVYAVAVKSYMRDATAGARTVTLNTKSGATDSPGSNAGFTPSTTYGWAASMFLTDPNTGTAWGVAGVNAAVSGYKITA
jgi:hypothetical protein